MAGRSTSAKSDIALREYGLAMEEEAYRLSSGSLGPTPSGENLVNVATAVQSAMDRSVSRFGGRLDELRQMDASAPTIACKKGCGHCCGTRVVATAPEIFRLANWILAHCTLEEIDSLKVRLANLRVKVLSIEALGERRPPIDCPILVDGSCSAHEGRPMVCRSVNSLDVGACIRGRENWEDETFDIPILGEPFHAGREMAKGVNRAMDERGIRSAFVEMPLALEIALANPNAAEEFLSGAPVFLDAEIAQPESYKTLP